MKITKLFNILVCSVCSLMLVTTGCAKDHKPEELDKMVEDFKAQIPKKSSDALEGKGFKIGSVNMGMTGEWFSEAMNGIWDASEDMGATAMMLDSENSLDKERENVQKLVDEGIDALVISPLDSNASIESLKPAIDAKIPIVTWNTSVNTDITSFVCVESDALGGDTGDYLCQYIKTYDIKELNLVIIGNNNYDVGIARCDGFRSSIKTMVDQGIIKLAEPAFAEFFDTGKETMAKLLKEHPETNAVWAWNQPSLLGTIEAVKESGRKDILVMGADMSMELAEDMLGSDVDLLSITTQRPYNMGYKAVKTAIDALNKKPVDKTVVIPLFTYTNKDRVLVERYIESHKGLIEWKGGQWYDK